MQYKVNYLNEIMNSYLNNFTKFVLILAKQIIWYYLVYEDSKSILFKQLSKMYYETTVVLCIIQVHINS